MSEKYCDCINPKPESGVADDGNECDWCTRCEEWIREPIPELSELAKDTLLRLQKAYKDEHQVITLERAIFILSEYYDQGESKRSKEKDK